MYPVYITIRANDEQQLRHVMRVASGLIESIDGLAPPLQHEQLQHEQPQPLPGLRRDLDPPLNPELRRRDAEILRLYLDEGKSSVDLGDKFGMSRERVCQILRRVGAIEFKSERKRAARGAAEQEIKQARKKAKRARDERIENALRLMRAERVSGMEAGRRLNLTGNERNLLMLRARELALPQRHGRWRDFSARETRVRELYAKKTPLYRIVQVMREEGDEHMNQAWVRNNLPELEFQRGRRDD